MLEFINTEGNYSSTAKTFLWKLTTFSDLICIVQKSRFNQQILYSLCYIYILIKNIWVMSSVNLLKNNLISQKDQLNTVILVAFYSDGLQ